MKQTKQQSLGRKARVDQFVVLQRRGQRQTFGPGVGFLWRILAERA